MVDLRQFRENARKDGLCAEYSEIWDNCSSKKQIMDMCLGSKGVDYLCDAYAKGWGISSSEIYSKFKPFINGNYTFNNSKYTSSLYCRYKGSLIASTTLLTFVDSDVTITIPKYSICKVYATGKTNIELKGGGECIVVAYGNDDDVKVVSKEAVRYKRLQKKDRDRYE